MSRRLELGMAGVSFVVAACGPSVDDIADVRVRTCGEDGPVLLKKHFFGATAWTVGERLVVGGFELEPDDDPAELHSPVLHAMGPCGEEPVELLRGDFGVHVEGDLLLVCDSAGHVDRLDPHGVHPPERLFERTSCHFGVTHAGLIAYDPVAQAILLRPEPSQDAVAVVTLAEGIADPNASCTDDPCRRSHLRSPYPFHVLDDHVYGVDTASRLLQIDADATTTVVATDVSAIERPDRGDRLVIETVALDDDGEQPDGLFTSWDPATGASVSLDLRTPWIDWPLALGRRPDDDAVPSVHVGIDLRDGSEVPLPSSSFGSWKPRAGRHLLLSSGGLQNNTYWLWSDEGRRWVDLGHYPGCSSARERDEHVEIFAYECVPNELWFADSGELWLVDFDGRRRLGATDVSSSRFSTSDRVVWSVSSHDDELAAWFGDLIVSEVDDGERWRIDRHALLHADRHVPTLDGDILYTVLDGDRTGLWRSALP